jgi:hypothetical protein
LVLFFKWRGPGLYAYEGHNTQYINKKFYSDGSVLFFKWRGPRLYAYEGHNTQYINNEFYNDQFVLFSNGGVQYHNVIDFFQKCMYSLENIILL